MEIPEQRGEHEGDDEAEEHRAFVHECFADLGNASRSREIGDLEFEDEQRHDNGKDAVTEGIDAMLANCSLGRLLLRNSGGRHGWADYSGFSWR
jgi:hypothetical protein